MTPIQSSMADTGVEAISHKRSRTEQPEDEGAQSKRAFLEDVPLDVVLDIFSYLDSYELFSISRLSRGLRDILMDQSIESVWRTARKNWDWEPPPIPEGMSESCYADLLLGNHCHMCGQSGGCEPTFWFFRVRCCRDCAYKTFPFFNSLKQKQPLAYRDKDVLPREIIQTKRGSDKTLPRRQIGHQALTDQLKEEFNALKTKEERASWIESKRQKRAAVEAHAKECNDWYSNMLAIRRFHREAERGQAIRKTTLGLGSLGLGSNPGAALGTKVI
ncbi:hypothetical protein D9757_015190 [Collybiopsis confluens]|uniref:F-box domain-containing protein n=1 Tax=Collybiopsis confluens TaxID=2823264 RepID=A0A8H5FLL7_9AGAR|nr:hypothetical protein D9757_015190 [Collybiopsis confluens]